MTGSRCGFAESDPGPGGYRRAVRTSTGHPPAAGALAGAPIASGEPQPVSRHIAFLAWTAEPSGPARRDLGLGTHQGTALDGDLLVARRDVGTRCYTDPHATAPGPAHYGWSAWVSPEVRPGFRFTSVVPSWNAATPAGTWLEVEVRVSREGVTWSPWYTLARWASSEADIHPTSVGGQDGAEATVATDVLEAGEGVSWVAYQLRVALMRRPGTPATASVRLVAAVAAEPVPEPVVVSPPDAARGVEVPVPAYSQLVHRGEYPQWDSGGESWCSPTSTSMVLGRWDRWPLPEEYAWVDAGIADPFVDHAARSVFDHEFQGAGNWAFNTAYAARYDTAAFVTRLRDLREAERFLAAGIPLVATVSFTREELAGSGYDTEGHLITIVGFDDAGDVICNDPASHGVPGNHEVRTVYDRGQFERLWLSRGGGVVYVVHPPGVPLPELPADAEEPNW